MKTIFTDLGSNKIREVLEIPITLNPCPQVFSVFEGTLRVMPTSIFDQPMAQVLTVIENHRTTYEIHYTDKLPNWKDG